MSYMISCSARFQMDIPCISMDIPRIYLVDIHDIHGISMPLDIHASGISMPLDIHGISMYIRVYPMYIGQDGIYMGHT